VASPADLTKLGVLARFRKLGWSVADHGDAAAPPSALTLTGEVAEVANSLAISAAKANEWAIST
jgi:hypothetical protein